MTNDKENPKEPYPAKQTPNPPQVMNPRDPKDNGDHKRKAGGEPKRKKKKEKPGQQKPFHARRASESFWVNQKPKLTMRRRNSCIKGCVK